MYGVVLGATTTGAAIAVLPKTGGNRSVITGVALASLVIGVAVLVTTAVRFVAKRQSV